MTDQALPPFNPDNPTEWGLVTSGYDLAPASQGPPLAIQVIRKDGGQTISTGILSGTDDQYSNGTLVRTILYFHQAEGMTITWDKVTAVAAMVAINLIEEEGNAEHDQGGEGEN